jgi:hypothetical protein
MQSYAVNTGDILSTICEVVRAEGYAKVDMAYDLEIADAERKAAANGGMVKFEDLKAGLAVLDGKRKAGYKAVDDSIAKLQAIIDAARSDLVVALRLDAVLEEFNTAGTDTPAAASAAIASILEIVKQARGR